MAWLVAAQLQCHHHKHTARLEMFGVYLQKGFKSISGSSQQTCLHTTKHPRDTAAWQASCKKPIGSATPTALCRVSCL